MTSYRENWNDTVIRAYDDGFPLLMPRWGYVVSAFVLFLIGFFGFFLNLMVILLMFKDRQLWTPLNIILFNLVCSDFSVSLLGNPFTLISALFHRWVFGHTMCVMYGFFMALLGIVSITTLTVLSFERYMIITRPLSARHLSSKGAMASILFIWIYSLALTTPPLLGWGNYVNEAANISCSVNWHEQSMNTLTYILFLFAMGQVVPMLVITFSYINIIRTMKMNSKRLGRVSRAEARVTGMIFVMIMSFTIAWTPYSVFALIEQFATEGIVSPGAGVIPALVAKSSICYDPLIYVGMNTQFRQSIKRVFGIHSKSGLSQTERGYENTLMSPNHKRSCEVNRYTSSESIVSGAKHHYKQNVTNQSSEKLKTDTNILPRIPELKTIQEKKYISEGERSDSTIYENESSCSSNKKTKLSLPCQNDHLQCNDSSPVLTIVDSDRLIFSKAYKGRQKEEEEDSDELDQTKNAYGNKAFDEHSTDGVGQDVIAETSCLSSDKENIIKHSYSLDLIRNLNDTKRRKLSVDTKLETFVQIKGYLKNTVVSRLFDHDPKQGQNVCKSYLYRVDKKYNEDNRL